MADLSLWRRLVVAGHQHAADGGGYDGLPTSWLHVFAQR